MPKKCYFHFPKVFLITFSEGNGRAQVEENNSNHNHTLVCDDDAHKVVLCTRSHFSCTRWVKEIDLKDTTHNKGKKPPHKKMFKKTQNKATGSSKIAKIIFWVKIQI